MWLRTIRVKNLKRLRDFSLQLGDEKGRPRKWTVLIGPNGAGKSSLLQAIALAAAGAADASELCNREMRESLLDKRLDRPKRRPGRLSKDASTALGPAVDIGADFVFGPRGRFDRAAHPLWGHSRDEIALWDETDGEGDHLRSRVRLHPASQVWSRAAYVDRRAGELTNEPTDTPRTDTDPTTLIGPTPAPSDPLLDARDDVTRRYWFVAAYGVRRDLPETTLGAPRPPRPAMARLRHLFTQEHTLIGPNFATLFGSAKVSQAYATLLRDVLLHTDKVVPGITNMELRGKGGITRTEHLTASHRFEQMVKGNALMLPALWLSHGYQSSLAWLSDLVGQMVLDASGRVEPAEMEGLVLIDEIDLYLHPTWQVGLIEGLKATFPRMQFIVTTHSPMLLSAFHRDEVVRLGFDEQGNVQREETPRDPRLLTGSELYEWFFGIDDLEPRGLHLKVDRYVRIARDPGRSEAQDALMRALADELRAEGLTVRVAVPRHGHDAAE